ncbi:MAG: hypothetical protein WCE75_15505 [Terracidiphilus sp.]
MEADWEFEIGAGAPVIEACWEARWPGYVDLRLAPERLREIPEAMALPALGRALSALNGPRAPLWTSKCDFWPQLDPGEFDPDEMDAPTGEAACAAGCYIDLLPRNDQTWPTSAMAEAACRRLCQALRAHPLRSCRVDLVLRRARMSADDFDTGITAYVTGCGATPEAAVAALSAALDAFAGTLGGNNAAALAGSPLQ